MKAEQTDELIELNAARVQKRRLETNENIRLGLAKAGGHTSRLTISMDAELFTALHRRARLNCRSIADEVRQILKDNLKQ